MAYPTAIGCGCLLGAGGASQLHAAEWSIQPILGWMLDYDSARGLQRDVQGSEEAVLSADVRLQRAIENMQLMIEPHFDLRRFSDSVWGPGDDRSLTGGLSWSRERSLLSLNGSIANQNTLGTEVLETGLVYTNTRRRLETASAELDLLRTEEHVLFTQLSYLGSSYSGPAYVKQLLPGYRYESASLGERFTASEHWTVSGSAFGDILHSDRVGGSSHEFGAQLELGYTRSEKYNFDLQVGESRRVLSQAEFEATAGGGVTLHFAPVATNGTNVSASGSRNFQLGSVSLSYTRSLVPYGNGFLVERQQIAATGRRSLSPYVDVDFSLIRIQNNDSTVRLGLDRRFYDNLGAGLNWKIGETWTLRSEATTSWAPPIGSEHTVHEWRAALTMTWKPIQTVISR